MGVAVSRVSVITVVCVGKYYSCTYLRPLKILAQCRALFVLAFQVQTLHLDEFVSIRAYSITAALDLPDVSGSAVDLHC